MNRLKIYIILCLLTIITFISCRKNIPEMIPPEDYPGNDFSSVFESFWTGMNHNYLFWDIDATDWDHVYKHYKPLFNQLNIKNDDDIRKAYEYFKEMTAGLVDGHYAIYFKKSPIQNSTIRPSFSRKKMEKGYHNPIPLNYFTDKLPKLYLNDYKRGISETEYGKLAAVSGELRGDILYLYFSNFLFEQLASGDPVLSVIDYFFNSLKNAKDFKGIIIDVRGNGGGNIADLNKILSSLINDPITIGYLRGKMGDGRLDYTPWTPYTIIPPSNAYINLPIVALVDLHSASSSELMAMGVSRLSNGYVVGERTWGAQGPLAENFIYNGGQFSTAFMELVYTSSLMTKSADGNIYEGVGFPPDVEAKYDENLLNSDKDMQLETAIQVIYDHK
ncbi:MAG: hypothetical protein LBH92_08330 [Bacteroidales bacterium]|jgi:C-terminal processing protease CtpA/Prc|nr:hypothetical protein [Bacteroidales bacterium]